MTQGIKVNGTSRHVDVDADTPVLRHLQPASRGDQDRCEGTDEAFAAGTASPPASDASNTTVVLVHGAFADGSAWDKVVPRLQARGLNVVSVQNPLTSLADEAGLTVELSQALSGASRREQ